MAIKDDLASMTRYHILPGIANQITVSSKTVNVALRFTRRKEGPAGESIGILNELERNAGKFYSDFDDANFQHKAKYETSFAQWYNHRSDMVIAGTWLEENLGMRTSQFLNLSSIQSLGRPDRLRILSVVEGEVRGSISKSKHDLHRTFHNGPGATDTAVRVPEGPATIFDETASLNGVTPAGLGTFLTHGGTDDPWATTAPGQTSVNINEPRFFVNPVTAGVNRVVSRAVIDDAYEELAARLDGFWICGCKANLYATLKREFDSLVRIPMGAGLVHFSTEAIQMDRMLIFSDAYAPANKMRFLHVGNPGAEDGSFYPLFWSADDGTAIGEGDGTMSDAISPATVPGSMPTSFPLGENQMLPFYTDDFERDMAKADAVAAANRLKFSWICAVRWANFEVRDLKGAND